MGIFGVSARRSPGIWAAAFLFAWANVAWGQNDAANALLARVQSERETIAQQAGMDEGLRGRVLQIYDEALQQLRLADEQRAKAAEAERVRAEAPSLLEQLQKELSEPPPQDLKLPPETVSLAELESALSQAESAYREAQGVYEQLLKEPARRRQRRIDIPAQQAMARQRVQDARDALGRTPSAGEAAEVLAAQQLLYEARLIAATEELRALELEVLALDARQPVLALRQEQAQRALAYAEKRQGALHELTMKRRKEAADRAAAEARLLLQEATSADESIRDLALSLAERNAQYAEQRTASDGVARKIEAVDAELDEVTAQLQTLNESEALMKERLKSGGLNRATGILMRKTRATLPEVRALRASMTAHRQEIDTIEDAQNALRERRLELAQLDAQIQERLQALAEQRTKHETAKLKATMRDLMQRQRELIEALELDYDRYLTALISLTSALEQLIRRTGEVDRYIRETILWIGGAPPLSGATLRDGARAAAWAVDGEAWREALGLIWRHFRRESAFYVPLLLALLWGVALDYRLRARLPVLAKDARNSRMTDFRPTQEAVAIAAVHGLVPAAAIYGAGYLLQSGAASVAQAATLGQALMAMSVTLFVLAAARKVLARDGLADAHFGWPLKRLGAARRLVLLLLLAWFPLVLANRWFEAQSEDLFKESAGRAACAGALLVFAYAVHRLSGIVYYGLVDLRSTEWFVTHSRLRRLVRALMVAVPLGLAALSLSEYYYTAAPLSDRLYLSALLIAVLMLCTALIRRWLLLTRRRLAIEQARRRREALKAEAEKERVEGAASISEVELLDKEVDIVRVDAQTQRLIRTGALLALAFGLWWVWVDFVPALSYFRGITLWSVTVTAEEYVATGTGTGEVKTVTRLQDITAADLGLALIILLIMVVAVRNLPGLIEILLLQRLKMGAGERYATAAITRYALGAVGLIMAFNAIGVGWSRVQWLVAALSVGLGFGLQEIFANFVSGLILLFERPMRVGDLVTVGNVSGTVTRISMRATTIMDFDNKELIVPNRSIVTGELVNWSLSDTVLRVVVPVGIAYGSDVEKAIEVLQGIVREHPDVLKEPAPVIAMTGFGDSALNLEVRVFCPHPDRLLRVRNDLHLQIYRGLQNAGIEIPFPQRDIHIRSGMLPEAEGGHTEQKGKAEARERQE